jgi:hypothetical protein
VLDLQHVENSGAVVGDGDILRESTGIRIG